MVYLIVPYHPNRTRPQTAGLLVSPGYLKVEWEAVPSAFRALFCGLDL